jgi:hypothetical protein
MWGNILSHIGVHHTTILLCSSVSFFVVAGKLILYEYLTVTIVSQKYRDFFL